MGINLVDISTPNPQSKELNERLIHNINDLGIIYINTDVDLFYLKELNMWLLMKGIILLQK